MKQVLRVALVGLLVALSGVASAVPIHWTLVGASFNDGSTASGSFDYDASTNTYSNVSIATTSAPGTSYDTSDVVDVPHPFFTSGATSLGLIVNFGALSVSGESVLNLVFLSALTDAGGIIAISSDGFPSFEGTCGASDCSSGNIDRVFLTGGAVQAPEPSMLALMGLGLFGLFGFARRRNK